MAPRIALAALVISACSMSQEFLSDGAVVRPDAGMTGVPPSDVVICGGVTCAAGQSCCFTTLTCNDAGACTLPASAPPGSCASNADCAPTEFCNARLDGPIESHCGGPGRCAPRTGREGCGGVGPVCGCDGRTYLVDCDASAQGVRVIGFGPCGSRTWPNPGSMPSCTSTSECSYDWFCDAATHFCEPPHPFISCGRDDQCGSGLVCCAFTGLCVDPARPDLCILPPDGTVTPCADDDDCAGFNEDLVPIPTYMCLGPGCTGPGGCVRAAFSSSCGGELDAVCGCNGTSYSNSCWASAAVTRIAHPGMCP